MKTEPISISESRELIQLEKIIQSSLVDGGEALKKIRDKRLYRADYDTFEIYCQEKWGWSRQRGFQIIDASEVVKALPEKCQLLVVKETAARELKKVPAPQREAVIEKVIAAGEKVTAAAIKAHAPVPPPPAPPAPPAKAPVPAKAPKPPIKNIYCKTGCEIPSRLWAAWEAREDVCDDLSELGSMKAKYKKLQGEEYLILKDGIAQQIYCALKNAQDLIETAQPFALCNICMGGPQQSGCRQCGKTGFVSKHIWDTVIDQKVKDQRAKAIELKGKK